MALTETKPKTLDSNKGDNSEQTKELDPQLAIKLLDERLELLERLLDLAVKNAPIAMSARLGSLALPDEAVTDRVLRCEAHLNRILYRAMDQLERLQRRRKGENVPPPLNVNLERRA